MHVANWLNSKELEYKKHTGLTEDGFVAYLRKLRLISFCFFFFCMLLLERSREMYIRQIFFHVFNGCGACRGVACLDLF